MGEKKRLNVLAIDREESALMDVKELLTEDYHVDAVTEPDPGSLVQAIKQGRYQIIIIDVSPPEEPILELLQQIRAADSDICVIATSALPSVEAAVRTLKHQAFDYLQKPLAPEELHSVLEAAIREKGLLVDLESRLNLAVGTRLRELRTQAGLTLKQLANRTGLSVSLISQIELGKSAASMSTLHKLATALQVKMTSFFETV